jgi:DsbC/DsbD-like thiol-disulfide interchange protein
MNILHRAPRALIVVALAVLAPGQVAAAAQVTVTTPWIEVHGSRLRLIAGSDPAKPGQSYLAGIEVVLADGWKTYWRMPGDAGVPPTFDWTGSSNAASIEVLYPAPMRFSEPAAETIGY